MVVGGVRYLATKANVRHVKARVETYVSNRSFGFAEFPQNRAVSRLAFIMAADTFPIENELHLKWWQEIVSREPFINDIQASRQQDGMRSDVIPLARNRPVQR